MEITDGITVPDDELHFGFARSGGPGGQNVNKVASKTVLHWRLADNTTLPAEARERLRLQQANRITAEGEVVIQSQRFRDQARNVEDCRVKLRDMVLRALEAPRPRKATRPTKGSKRRRRAAKRRQSERKARRRQHGADE
jgi:ribosome-associated protein